VAALLLGLPTAGSGSFVNRAADYAEQSLTWGFFFQDDWKVTPRLTLNLGLRWEFERALTERLNRSVVSFDSGYVQPFAGQAQANFASKTLPAAAMPIGQINANGGLTFAGINGVPREFYNTPKRNLLPRFGFAYQLTPETVLRGGFGIYYGFLGERRGDVIQTGFSQQTPFNPFDSTGTKIISSLSNPFPNGILEPVGSANGFQTNLGQNITFFNQNPLMPRMYRWQFDVQRQLPGRVLLEAAYVGNKGVGIEVNRNVNALPNQYLSTLNVRDNAQNAFLTASVPNPFFGLLPSSAGSLATSSTVARQQLLLPYPEFAFNTNSTAGSGISTTTNEGYSWYHSLQVRLEKRFSTSLTVIGNYTFSKYMQATELLNAGDLRPTRMISDQDAPHRFAADFIYQLPFGKGHRLLSNVNPILDRIVGGWEVNGIWTFQSGFPLNFIPGTPASVPDFFFTGDPSAAVLPVDQRSPERWFNTSVFQTNANLQPVSHLRVNPYRFPTLRGPRQNNVDLSIIKDTRIRESIMLRFTAQALNAFNHPLFPAPGLSPGAPSTFGIITASTQANYPRDIQLALKLMF
jgi:hypothetical protein